MSSIHPSCHTATPATGSRQRRSPGASLRRDLVVSGRVAAPARHPRGPDTRVLLAVLALLTIGALADADPAGVLIAAPNRWDMVYDDVRKVLYITSGTEILRYCPASQTFLAAFDCGADAGLTGIDLSPNGRYLIACADRTDNDNAWVYVVDLSTDTVRRQTFPRFWSERGTWSVAFGNDGAALITGRFAGSGWVQMRKYHPGTGAVTWLPSVRQDTMACASADGSVIGLAESNTSGGAWDRYRVSDGDLAHVGNTSAFNFEIGVNRNATQYAVPVYVGTYVYNSNYDVIATVGAGGGAKPIGVAYHPKRDYVYFPLDGTRLVRVYRTSDVTPVAEYDMGHSFGWPGNHAYAHGRIKVARDGSYFFCTVTGGIRCVPATTPTTPTSLVVNHPNPPAGQNVTATASGSWVVSGAAIRYTYEWSRTTPADAVTPQAWGDVQGATLPGSMTHGNEVWEVRARATDGTTSSDWTSAVQVTIADGLPTRPTSVVVAPENPLDASNLTATATGSTDPESGDAVDYQYQWNKSVDGGATWPYAGSGPAVSGARTAEGEQWRVRARATDGVGYSEWSYSAPVTIGGNSPPTRPTDVTVRPEDPLDASDLTARATGSTDPDGDETVTYQYQWNKSSDGGAVWTYAGYGPTVPGARTTAGEQWRVRARATDGIACSEWRYGTPVTIGGNSPPTRPTAVVVSPERPGDTDDLTAAATGSTDPDGDGTIRYEYQWNKSADNGQTWRYAGYGARIPAAATTIGETWRVRARANDGIAQSEWRYGTPVFIVGNTPPSRPTSVVITPDDPTAANPLTAVAEGSADPDSGDTIGYEYQWNKSTDGGTTWPYAGSGPTIPAGRTAEGELWRVRARATDGHEPSAWSYSTPVTIGGNSPPSRPASVVITPEQPTEFDDLTATASGATDPDSGDTIHYEYQWSKSVDSGQTWQYAGHGPTIPAAQTAQGEQWRALARANDGTTVSEWRYSAMVRVGPPPPPGSAVAVLTAVAAPARGGVAQITVHLSAAATVQVTVVNIAGRTVAVLPECALVRGSSTLLWNGRSTSGTLVPTGSYFVNVIARTAEGQQSRTCTPLRLTR